MLRPTLLNAVAVIASALSIPDNRREQAGACTAICDLLSEENTALAGLVLRHRTNRSLRPLLVALGFLVATSAAAEAGAMFGLFPSSIATTRLRSLGVVGDRRAPLLTIIRSILLSWATRAWRRRFLI